MSGKRKEKLSTSRMTNFNQKMTDNLQESDNENVYLSSKYPKDNKYEEFIKNFEINTQDIVEAGFSNKLNSQIISENDEKNCCRCNYKFNRKSYSVGCFNCNKWYCLSCAKLSKKEISELKKLKKNWKCITCNENVNKEISLNVHQLEEENKLFKKIINDMNEKIQMLITKLEVIENNNFFNKMDEVDKKIEILIKKLDDSNAKQPIKNISYSEILTKKPPLVTKTNLPVVIIKPKINQSSQKTKQDVQKKVNPVTIKASINKVQEIRNGGIIIKSYSEEEIHNLKTLSEQKLNENYTVEISKMKSPKLIIIGSRKQYEEQELMDELKALNHIDNDDKLIIKSSRKLRFKNKYIICIETSGKTFNKLVNKEISLGWDRCKIKEALDIIFCFKCCEYGHKANTCSKNQVCQFCSSEHFYWKCNEHTPKCINCKISNNKYNTKYDYVHEANSNQCPIHMYKMLRAKEKINYSK